MFWTHPFACMFWNIASIWETREHRLDAAAFQKTVTRGMLTEHQSINTKVPEGAKNRCSRRAGNI